MDNHYIALAVPVFFALIAIELIVARALGRAGRIYRLGDAINDLSCGMTSQLTAVFYGTAILAAYSWIFKNHRLITFENKWAPWVIAFFGVDFFYYWWHRFSHEINFLWAAHVVHHQSEDYNLAVALRQAVLTAWTGLPFYLPLAFVGVPPVVYATTLAFSTLYQFWIHTELVPKARGPIDWILNLPSHHRVHHAINKLYLDKNYGATLIVWDRLFGTYQEETEAPVYGITKALRSFNPMWAQVHYWIEMARVSIVAPRWRDKLKVWVASPAWHAEGVPAPAIPVERVKYDPRPSRARQVYILINFVLMVGATFSVMMWANEIPVKFLAAGVAVILTALLSFGALQEERRWAVPVEMVRMAMTAALVVAWFTKH